MKVMITVCVLGKVKKHLGVGVSTSGLFMKQEGRVGDSPIIGSGFYADSLIGCAAATGLGEGYYERLFVFTCCG